MDPLIEECGLGGDFHSHLIEKIGAHPMIDEIYQRFRYERSIDYKKPLTPPLGPEDTAWLKRQLRATGGRR
jgi:hypothetical protein